MPKKRLYIPRVRRFIPMKGQYRLNPKNTDFLQEWTGLRWKTVKRLKQEEDSLEVFNPEVDFREGDKNAHERNASN